MNIHEYQAKSLLAPYSIPCPLGQVADSVLEAVASAKAIEKDPSTSTVWAVKAQILAGGRGKAGGIVLAHSLGEVEKAAASLLGKTLVTPQTGLHGQKIRRLYIEEGVSIEQEFYMALTLDRREGGVRLVASSAGGVSIEETAQHYPEKILSCLIPPCTATGFPPFYQRLLAQALQLDDSASRALLALLKNLLRAFWDYDATLIELNPLVLTPSQEFVALDAKMSFDDNALFRHPAIAALQEEPDSPLEKEAAQHDLSYVKLEGTIGCLVNGAGLAMATLDLIQKVGLYPANFLDVGGGASAEKVAKALKIILSDPSVEAVLINIFGGIMRGDILAEGLVEAVQALSSPSSNVPSAIPFIVRLQGTNKAQGRQILEDSGLPFVVAEEIEEAVQKVAETVNIRRG